MESIIQSHTIVLLILNKMHPHLAFSLCTRLVLDRATLIPFLCWTARNFIMMVRRSWHKASSKEGGRAVQRKRGVGRVWIEKSSERCGEDTQSLSAHPWKSGCRSPGLRWPEIEQSFMPELFHYLGSTEGQQPSVEGFAWAAEDV